VNALADFAHITTEEALRQLRTDRERRLSSQEAEKRLEQYGLNQVPERSETLSQRIFRRFAGSFR
jgi:H+-transporting ATPase